MASLSYNKEAEIILAFNSTSRYLNDLLNIENPYFEGMVGRIYPPELQLLFVIIDLALIYFRQYTRMFSLVLAMI